jgi:hypothetical protein
MDSPKPNYFRPALIAGAVAGLLSGLPLLSIGNCVCCLWIVGGAALSVRWLAKDSPVRLTSGDGALTGALTGIVAAVVQSLVSLPFRSVDPEQLQQVMDMLGRFGLATPAGVADQAARMSARFQSPGWFLLFLLAGAVMLAIVGALGGLIGYSLFVKNPRPSAPTAPEPPRPPQGPSDAA